MQSSLCGGCLSRFKSIRWRLNLIHGQQDIVILAGRFCGRWTATVNGAAEFDTDLHGRLHLTGQILDAEIHCTIDGAAIVLFAELSATGQYGLFGLPGLDTVEKAVSPPGAKSSGLPERVRSADEVVAHFTTYIEKLAARAHPVPEFVSRAVSLIEAHDGAIAVAEVAAQAGTSERQLRRDFTRIVGMSPKVFCRTLQVNAALNALLSMDEETLADVAMWHGFSDQAHMTRSFVEFLGSSPNALTEGIEPTLAKFVGQSRGV